MDLDSMPKSTLNLNIFDGTRQPFTQPIDILITIIAGNQETLFSGSKRGNSFTFHLPFFNNLFDQYRVIVSADGHRQVGFTPVMLNPAAATNLDLMLAADDPGYSFVNARWEAALQSYPFLAGDTDAVTAQARYENMLEQQENVLACFLNLGEAMSQIHLQRGTPLDYIEQVRWDKAPAKDRFFAYCDAKLVDQVKQAAAERQFAEEPNPAVFHPGSTASWKEIRFGEANVQLTFHQNPPDCKTINGVDCVTVEPDIDFYKDLAAHAIFEVIPNGLTHTLTNPIEVYVLRWVAGQHSGLPQFEPLYTLT
jgi:hypothetical protein